MRLFAAIDFDEPARLAVAEIQAGLGRAFDRDRLRWVMPGQMHLTLVFLGDLPPARVEELAPSLAEPAQQPAFDLVLRGLGVFPPRGAPRALWIGVQEGDAKLHDLQREIVRRVRRAGIDSGSEPFRPHLTIARFRRSRPSDGHVLRSQASPDHGIRQRVDHVTLYESVLSSEPPRYVALARANLTSI